MPNHVSHNDDDPRRVFHIWHIQNAKKNNIINWILYHITSSFHFYTNLNMPMFAQCGYNTFFNGPATGATNWYTHFIMATQAV